MAKRQTTLWQTWGYEGNMSSQARGGGGVEDAFDNDDEEFNRALQESVLVAANKVEGVGGPSAAGPSTSCNLSLGATNMSIGATNMSIGATNMSIGATNMSIGANRPNTDTTPIQNLPGFDLGAGSTWIYPTNKSYRTYQHDIVKSCLFHNTLVCLPTGLGKTFIAAVVMYNYYRWYPQGKIVFMAPTKPLVAQQIEACFNVMGIPQEDTMEMTGSVRIDTREKAWKSKRVFFLTPQVMSNDLSRGLFPAKDVKLLIVDEAHKAQGEYAYCQVAKELDRSQASVRIVALSATPGNDLVAVKNVLQNLFISHIELRNEESPDILPYTNERRVDKFVIPMGEELTNWKRKLFEVLEIYTKRLSSHKALRQGHNPAQYSKFAILRARDEWRQNPPGDLNASVKGIVENDFAVCMSLYHGHELLVQHGMRPFYNFFNKREEADENFSSKRIKTVLGANSTWRDMMATLAEQFSGDATNSRLNQSKIQLTQATQQTQTVTTTSHPKMEKLISVVLEHFKTFKQKDQDTRVMIFSQYRDSVTEIAACLSAHSPTIKPMPFVGQASTQGKKGLNQKDQLEVLSRFRDGGYNTLVATCVGEEGLDIGEVDLIVLFDVSKSPIRLVQRMGRTGRKRAGRIVVLVTEGMEERKYNQSLLSKKTINKAILDKDRLIHVLYPDAPRMVPQGLEPVCHQMKMVTEAFKHKLTKGSGQTTLTRSLKPVNRYDVFRKNCGFLSELEQERWARLCDYTGDVKRLKDPVEMWTADEAFFSPGKNESVAENTFDLSEFVLWQTDQQNRTHVSVGALSSTYTSVLSLIHNQAELETRTNQLRANIEARASNPNQRTEAPREKKGGSRGSKQQSSQVKNPGVAGRPGSVSPFNNILKYFKPNSQTNKPNSQTNKPSSQSTTTKTEREKLIAQLLGDIDEEDDDIFEIPVENPATLQEHPPTQQDNSRLEISQIPRETPEAIDDNYAIEAIDADFEFTEDELREKALIDELLSDHSDCEDSGFGSPPDLPVFKLDLNNLDKDELATVDFRFDYEGNKAKYRNLYLMQSRRFREYIKSAEVIKVLPVSTNLHLSFNKDDIFNSSFEDSFIEDKIEPTVPVKRSSPAVKVNDKPETSGEDGVDVEVVDEPGDAVDVGDAWSQFDIGSPENDMFEPSVLEEPRRGTNITKPSTMKSVQDPVEAASQFDIGSPVLSLSPERPKTQFDIGSPIISLSPERPKTPEEPPKISPEKSKLTASDGFDGMDIPTSPILSKKSSQMMRLGQLIDNMAVPVSLVKGGRMSTSTPLNPATKRPRPTSSLTPIKEPDLAYHHFSPLLKQRHLATDNQTRSPLLKQRHLAVNYPTRPTSEDMFETSSVGKPSNNQENMVRFSEDMFASTFGDSSSSKVAQLVTPVAKRLVSEDMFGTSDDDIFGDLTMPPVVAANSAYQDVLGATQLVAILNKTSGSDETTSARSRLSSLADLEAATRQTKGDKPTGLVRPQSRQSQATESRQSQVSQAIASPSRQPQSMQPGTSSLRATGQEEQIKTRITYPAAVSRKATAKKRLSSVFDDTDDFTESITAKSTNQAASTNAAKSTNQAYTVSTANCTNPLVTANQRSSNTPRSFISGLSGSRPKPSPETKRLEVGASSRGVETKPAQNNLGFENNPASPVANFSLDISEDMFAEDLVLSQSMEEVKHFGQLDDSKPETKPGSKLTSNIESKPKAKPKPDAGQTMCPICGEGVAGQEGGPEINAHVDLCLSKQLIEEFSQQPNSQSVTSLVADSPSTRPPPSASAKRKFIKSDTSDEVSFSPVFKSPAAKKSNRMNQLDSDSEQENPSSPVLSRTNLCSTTDEDSPIFRGKKKSLRILATQGSPEGPHPPVDESMGSPEEDLLPVDESTVTVKQPKRAVGARKAKKSAAVEFFDVEAVLSGSDASSDEEVDDDRFEESFMDDATQQQNTTMYLRSIKSPIFKHPVMRRPIRPITDSIYSQALEDSEGSYLEDSFCVGSQEVDYLSEPDTLDLIEEENQVLKFNAKRAKERGERDGGKRKAKEEDAKPGKRRRIIAPADDSVLEVGGQTSNSRSNDGPEESCVLDSNSVSLLSGLTQPELGKQTRKPESERVQPPELGSGSIKAPKTSSSRAQDQGSRSRKPKDSGTISRKVEEPGSGSRTIDSVSVSGAGELAGTLDDSIYCVKPDLSESIGSMDKSTILIGSSEINTISEIVSALKHNHQLNVVIRGSEVPFVISRRMGAIRISESEFTNGSNRKKLKEKLSGVRRGYDKCAIIVESDKVKPGDRPRVRHRTKVHDTTLAQLAATSALVLYSENRVATAAILADLVVRENNKDMGLPRAMKETVSQELMLKWVLKLPNIGLGCGLALVHTFPTTRSLLLAKQQELEACMSRVRAVALVTLFTNKYDVNKLDFVPL